VGGRVSGEVGDGLHERHDLRGCVDWILIRARELVDEAEAGQNVGRVDHVRSCGTSVTGAGHSRQQDIETPEAPGIPVRLPRGPLAEDGQGVEASERDAVGRVERTEDRHEALQSDHRIGLHERVGQPDEPARLGEIVEHGFEERLTRPEAIVDREPGDPCIPRDRVQGDRVAARQCPTCGGDDPAARGVHSGASLLHPVGPRTHACILTYNMYAVIMEDNTDTVPRYSDLAGRVAVVTGGSRGIGAATARALAVNGAAVAVVGRDRAAIDATVGSIASHTGKVLGVAADCTSDGDLAALRATVEARLGPVDILAAFAGGNGMPVPTRAETGEHWRSVLEGDLTSTFLTVAAFLPGMIERHFGVIITMSSAAARQAAKSSAAYAAAKAGVIAFSRHLAAECAKDGIRVNCLAPSAIENDRMRAWMSDEARAALGASFPLGRIGQPDDVAAAAVFLASSASSWITGMTLDIAGGKVML
jgi:3-oxoacyl-[acyl-carrier protein] reductase